MYQETLSLDGLIDRLNTKIRPSDKKIQKIATILNHVFHQKIETNYVNYRLEKIACYQKQLKVLLKSPGIEQRTSEWHAARKTLITASDFAQALGEGKFGSQKDLIKKKCGYEEEKFNANLPPLKWGTMFEQVASDIYTMRNGVKIHEFGLLRHPTVSHFGASPDGITEHGVMLEIKCPFKRKINGIIPPQYYYQIQGQLDVCGLQECDYLECEFGEVDSLGDLIDRAIDMEKGAIVEKILNGSSSYVYSVVLLGDIDVAAMNTWITSNTIGEGVFKTHFWYLERYNTIRVYKDDGFIEEKLGLVADVWEQILSYRADKEMYDKYIGTTVKRSATAITEIKGYCFLD
jgi:putative phage-type endonuclease